MPKDLIGTAKGIPWSMEMRSRMKAKLSSRGWKAGDAQEFLDLTPEEAALIELRLKLAEGLKARRKRKRLTQHDLAAAVQSAAELEASTK